MPSKRVDKPMDAEDRDAKELQKLARRLCRIAEKIEDHADRHERMRTRSGTARKPPPSLEKRLRKALAILDAVARIGVPRVEIQWSNVGRDRVRIGEFDEIALPRSLTDLLSALCAMADTPSEDPLVPFKSVGEILHLLHEKRQVRVSRHAFSVRVSRLKDELGDQGIPPQYVRKGTDNRWRFALRKVPPTWQPGTPPGDPNRAGGTR